MLKNMGVIVTLLVLSVVCVGTVMAVELTWNNGGDSDWGYVDPGSGESNWLAAGVPTSQIPNVDTPVTLDIDNTDTISVEAPRSAMTVTVDGGAIHVNDGQSLSIAQTATFGADTLLSLGTDAILSVGDGGAINALQTQGNATLEIGGSEMIVGSFTDGGVAATIVKSGPGDLVLASDANDVDDITFDIQGGRLVGYHGSNPLAGATLDINGGEVLLSATPDAVSPVTYDNRVLVTSDGALTAGPGNAGETESMTVRLDQPTGDLAVADGATLSLGSSGEYSLTVADPLAGLGTVRVEQGNVTLAGGGQLGSLEMIGGTLSLEADLEVVNASMLGGTATTANESSITVTELLKLGDLGLAVDPAAPVTLSGPDMANVNGSRTLTFSGGTHTLSSLALPESIVINGDFEDNQGSNGGIMYNWNVISNSFGTWDGLTGSEPHGGEWMLHVGKYSNAGGRYQDLATVVGQQYMVRLFSSGFPTGEPIQSGSVMAAATDGTDFFELPFTVPAYVSQDSWTEIVGTFEAQESTTRLKLWNHAGSAINIDDVEVLALLAQGPWNLPNTNLMVTATSTLVGNAANDLGLGNVSIADGQTLTVQDAKSLSTADLSLGEGATLQTPVSVGGTLSTRGTNTILGLLKLGSEAAYQVDIAQNQQSIIQLDGGTTAPGGAWLAGSLTVDAFQPIRVDGSPTWGDLQVTVMEVIDVDPLSIIQGIFENVPDSYSVVGTLPSEGASLGPGLWFGNAADADAGGNGVYYTETQVNIGVFQAAPGDTDGNRKVEGQDILNILQAGLFGDGVTPEANWGNGDFNADGKISGEDILALLSTGLFGDGTYPDSAAAAAATAGVKLLVTQDGLVIDTDGATVTGFVLSSESGILTGDDAEGLGLFQEDTDTEISGAFAMSLNGEHGLGDVIGQTDVDLGGDLTLAYTMAGVPGVFTASVVVPEPGTLMLLLGGLIGLLIWRRRM